MIALDVKQLESLLGSFSQLVGIGSFLRGRIGNAQQKTGQVGPFLRAECALLAPVVFHAAAHQHHGVGQAAVDQIERAAFRLADVAVGLVVAM